MADEELRKACLHLRAAGLDFALLSSHESIAHASGFDEPVPIGAPRDFSGGVPLSLVALNVKEETGFLVVADSYGGLASEQSRLGTPITFKIFDTYTLVDPVESFLNGARDALRKAGLAEGSRARIGVERATLPVAVSTYLAASYPNVAVTDATLALEKARMTKTAREIQLMRNVARFTDAGQSELVKAAKGFSGATEYELWANICQAIQGATAKPFAVPMSGELVTGPRTNEVHYPGGPRPRAIAAGDTGILDISVRVDGYWCDCCNTVVFGGEPNAEQRRHFKGSRDGFEAAVETLKPGARCADIEAAIRAAFKKNGFGVTHYGGHQIGTTVNERPRIVPYDTTVVEPGMVFCFEPGVYAGASGATGARLERMVLVTESGNEILNHFPWGMEV
jgi:Xaa-Pro aminopeptidase